MAIRSSSLGGIPFGNDAGRPASPSLGQPYFNGQQQRLELYTALGWQNIVAETPGVVGYTGTLGEISGGTLVINGTNFVSGANVFLIGIDGTEIQANSVTVNSIVQISATFGAMPANLEPYDIKVVNPSNLYGFLPDAVTVNDKPVWNTSSGLLGSFVDAGVAVSIQLSTSDEENNSISYSIASGSLPPGLSLSSSGLISGNTTQVSSDTTYNFVINASDGINTVSRNFSIIITFAFDGSSSLRAGTSAWNIKQITNTTTDGLYWVKNSNVNGGNAFQVYCDMNTNGGGWMLTVCNNTNTKDWSNSGSTNYSLRNQTSPQITGPYSILQWADYFKRPSVNGVSGAFEYMLGASGVASEYNRAGWARNGGIFRTNQSYNINTSSVQNNISVLQWLPGSATGFDANSIEQTVPYFKGDIQSGYFTTHIEGSGGWWGTIITNYVGYKTAPWISGGSNGADSPEYIWYWIR